MKSNTMITWLALMAIGLGGIVLVSRSKPASPQSPVIQSATAPQSYDFGKISMAKGKVSHNWQVKNEKQETMTIEKIYTSCMCTTALLSYKDKVLGPFGMPGHGMLPKVNQTLGVGETANLEVVFDPAAHGPAGVGKVNRDVFVETTTGQQFKYSFTAEVTP